jgi:hypothetical protein
VFFDHAKMRLVRVPGDGMVAETLLDLKRSTSVGIGAYRSSAGLATWGDFSDVRFSVKLGYTPLLSYRHRYEATKPMEAIINDRFVAQFIPPNDLGINTLEKKIVTFAINHPTPRSAYAISLRSGLAHPVRSIRRPFAAPTYRWLSIP